MEKSMHRQLAQSKFIIVYITTLSPLWNTHLRYSSRALTQKTAQSQLNHYSRCSLSKQCSNCLLHMPELHFC